jgi:hypothetical protein
MFRLINRFRQGPAGQPLGCVAGAAGILTVSIFIGCVFLLAASAARAYESAVVVNGGTISGTVGFVGAAPKPVALEIGKDRDACAARALYDQSLLVGPGGAIANAVVTLTDIARGAPLIPAPAVRFVQKGCEYTPHVAAFPAGSTVEIVNDDGILHSIHTESAINPVLDLAQPAFKKIIRIRIGQPEAIKVGCDAHNWMVGWWYAAGNPYYAVTGGDGRFMIKDVPPGTYTLQVWQERLGVITQKVTVKGGAIVTVAFTMKARRG